MPAIVVAPSALAPKMPASLPKAAKHICLDLETGRADDDAIELVQQFARAAANIKDDEKAAASLEAKRAKIRENAALLDAAPISCLSFVTEAEHAVFYYRGRPWPKKMKVVTEIK